MELLNEVFVAELETERICSSTQPLENPNVFVRIAGVRRARSCLQRAGGKATAAYGVKCGHAIMASYSVFRFASACSSSYWNRQYVLPRPRLRAAAAAC